MKFYISTKGIKRLTISSPVAGKGLPETAKATTALSRRIPSRTLLPVVLVLGIVLPFLFVRIAFLVLESTTVCYSPLDCIGWRFFNGADTSLLREELSRALVEANKEGNNINEEGIGSFNELVKEMTSKRQDVKAFAFKTKAMVLIFLLLSFISSYLVSVIF
ncbi:probable galacturonosyltransferase 15 isoform X2 [Quercus suber]|uniref:probable galacturonosyltransferase 15 isoform X2 n=1 Tax=Quercus suber TaxID=58331 RepID=UPI0032DFF4DC